MKPLSFTQVRGKVMLRQYVPGLEAPQEMPVNYPKAIAKSLFGKKLYTAPVLDFLGELLKKIAATEGTLVFSPTSGQATRTALALGERGEWSKHAERIAELGDYVVETIHPQYALAATLQSGIAYHHGKMPQHARVAVEQAFGCGDVHVLVCTTTLMQGVNLPAKNLIARNPDLFVRGGARTASLTAYEFGNLRGRAGRLLRDFVGRAIVLDETAFDQGNLDLDFPEKNVESGYSERFEGHRDEIMGSLRRGDAASVEQPNSDLVVYVRQAIVRYGSSALQRLARSGIRLSDEEYGQAARHLRDLEVPMSICLRAPYWDPLVLDQLYRDETACHSYRTPLLRTSLARPWRRCSRHWRRLYRTTSKST
jgi:replicative superfamily II helicase